MKQLRDVARQLMKKYCHHGPSIKFESNKSESEQVYTVEDLKQADVRLRAACDALQAAKGTPGEATEAAAEKKARAYLVHLLGFFYACHKKQNSQARHIKARQDSVKALEKKKGATNISQLNAANMEVIRCEEIEKAAETELEKICREIFEYARTKQAAEVYTAEELANVEAEYGRVLSELKLTEQTMAESKKAHDDATAKLNTTIKMTEEARKELYDARMKTAEARKKETEAKNKMAELEKIGKEEYNKKHERWQIYHESCHGIDAVKQREKALSARRSKILENMHKRRMADDDGAAGGSAKRGKVGGGGDV
jgi:chromosome segregation ATPase